jgi:hypothetical protein
MQNVFHASRFLSRRTGKSIFQSSSVAWIRSRCAREIFWLSWLMATTVISGLVLYTPWRNVSSSSHRGHQEAQKARRMIFPFRLDRETGFPLREGSVTSGTGFPIFTHRVCAVMGVSVSTSASAIIDGIKSFFARALEGRYLWSWMEGKPFSVFAMGWQERHFLSPPSSRS